MRARKSVTATAAGLALAVGAAPAAAATWTLEDLEQRICVDPEYGHAGAYFLGSVSGSWSRTITTGLSDLPPGSVFKGSSVLPPSSHENPPGAKMVNVFAGVAIGPAPAGEYVARLWATDGSSTQSQPVRIVFDEAC
ncbi:DUF5980 family protein [Lentzea sp.]|uniref:DUF5980 family protein n=1 Tax=Lentzea sp. TaxID=56099 RepID=UPI002ED5F24C